MPTEMFGVPGISSGSQNGSVSYCQVQGRRPVVCRSPRSIVYGLAIGPYGGVAGGQNHGPYIQRPKALMPVGSPGFWAGM